MPLTCAIFQRNQTNRSFFSQGFLVSQNLPCNSNEPIERIGAVRKNKRFVGAIETSAARSIACARLLVSAVSEKSGRAVIKRVSEKRRERKGKLPRGFRATFLGALFVISWSLEPRLQEVHIRKPVELKHIAGYSSVKWLSVDNPKWWESMDANFRCVVEKELV